MAEYKNCANRLIACKLVKTHQDCKNRKLKTTEKLFQAKFHVQKLKYLLGNLGYILSTFWGEKKHDT